MFKRLPLLVALAVGVTVLGLMIFQNRLSNSPDGGKSDTVHRQPSGSNDEEAPNDPPRQQSDNGAQEQRRRNMVERQLRGRDITDERVLQAMLDVPRHEFVPRSLRSKAYDDHPLPIGHDQTISQPYIVALMTQLVRPRPDSRALDIGTGSGYQAAVLAELVQDVYSVEILCPLADEARDRLTSLKYENVTVRCGDGYQGWKDQAPFDVIIVAAAPKRVPEPLIEQLALGGKMVIPVGTYLQDLRLIEKQSDGSIKEKTIAPVRFVPMTGEARK